MLSLNGRIMSELSISTLSYVLFQIFYNGNVITLDFFKRNYLKKYIIFKIVLKT